MLRALLICVLFTFCHCQVFGQHVIIQGKDTLSVLALQDSMQAKRFVNSWIVEMIDQGYPQASHSSHKIEEDSSHITELFLGEQISYSDLYFIEQNEDTIRWSQTISAKVKELANEGYPFARLILNSVSSIQGTSGLSLIYEIDYGPEIFFDSVAISGDISLKESVLYNLLDLYPGQPYSEEQYTSISRRIEGIEFIEEVSESDVGFFANKAVIFLDLKELDINSFDAMVGLLPNAENGSKRVNGFVDLHLANLFRSAVSLDVDWSAFGQQSQAVNISSHIPTLGRTNLGLSVTGSILRQDTSFVTSFFETSFLIKTLSDIDVGFGYRRGASTNLNQSREEIVGFNYDWYNASLCYNCSLITSQKRVQGWSISTIASLGQREITEGERLGESSLTLNIENDLIGKASFASKALFQSNLKYGVLNNPEGLVENEKFRLGGLNNMRGFFENQFFVSQYLNLRNDIRLYLEEQSYIFGFVDGGFIQTGPKSLYGSGGIGLSINTNAGILNLIFAQGRIFDQNSSFNSLIHFGYSAVF